MNAVPTDKMTAIHNNVRWIIERVINEQLENEKRLKPLVYRFASEASDDEIYFAVIVISYSRWSDLWRITPNNTAFSLFQALAESARDVIEQHIARVRAELRGQEDLQQKRVRQSEKRVRGLASQSSHLRASALPARGQSASGASARSQQVALKQLQAERPSPGSLQRARLKVAKN